MKRKQLILMIFIVLSSVVYAQKPKEEYFFKDISTGSKIEFYFNDKLHNLYFDERDFENKSVKVKIDSMYFDLSFNHTRMFDLNSDNKMDIAIELIDFTDYTFDINLIFFKQSDEFKVNIKEYIIKNKTKLLIAVSLIIFYFGYYKNKLKWRRKKSQLRKKRV